MKLNINHRQHFDPEYASALADIGVGVSSVPRLCAPFPLATGESAVYCPCPYTEDIDDVFGHVFPSLLVDGSISDEEAATCAILATTNASVDELNKKVQLLRPNHVEILKSSDYISDAAPGERSHFSDLFLNRVNAAGVPPHELALKVDDFAFVIRNYSHKEQLMNGTKVSVLALPSSGCRGVLIRHLGTGQTHLLPRILFEIKYNSKRRNVTQFKIMRRQYPLRLCYAMTVNKAMGQTLSKVALDLRLPVFSHGQLYVALGRVCRREDALVVVNEDSRHKTNGRVLLLNKVRQDLLV